MTHYAILRKGTYWYPYTSKKITEMYLSRGEVAVEVSLKESDAGSYWGWIDPKGDHYSMVYPDKKLFNMCFPYGPEIEVSKSRGRIVRLNITPVEVK